MTLTSGDQQFLEELPPVLEDIGQVAGIGSRVITSPLIHTRESSGRWTCPRRGTVGISRPLGYGPVGRKYRWKESKTCYWCGRRLQYKSQRYPDNNQATRDHLIPRSLANGRFELSKEFQVAACRACNGRRGNSMDWIPHHLKGEHDE